MTMMKRMTPNRTSPKDRGQLALDLAFRPAMSREDFMVAASNEAAVRHIDNWPNWSAPTLLIVGPQGSGKSHLAQVFRMRAGGSEITADALRQEQVPDLLADGACVVEDLPGAGGADREVALFHLLNLAKETRSHLLLTARDFSSTWNIGLPDLASRLAAVPTVSLGLPCDELLRGLLVKLFSDKQIKVDEAVIAYLVRNMERSGDAAIKLVEQLDRISLETKSSVTRPFVAKVLADQRAETAAE
ncbi:MAG: hypothetical protein AAGF86_01810 [Pseudomonadota bacterium]